MKHSRGIKRLLKIDPVNATIIGIPLVVLLVFAFIIMKQIQFQDAPVTGEHTHWYGTVRHIGDCHRGKHYLRCHVYVDGREKSYHLTVTRFPGSNVSVGDRIGYLHREQGGGYRSYLRRNDRLMSSGTCYGWMGCVARYNEEHGYSK